MLQRRIVEMMTRAFVQEYQCDVCERVLQHQRSKNVTPPSTGSSLRI
jgi:hypothetical protein